MVRLTEVQCQNAIGRLQGGATQQAVANYFGVTRQTISNLWRRRNATGNVRDRPRSGRLPPCRTATYGYNIYMIRPLLQAQQRQQFLVYDEYPIRLYETGYGRRGNCCPKTSHRQCSNPTPPSGTFAMVQVTKVDQKSVARNPFLG
jgi:hypothetical protein